MRNGGSSVGRTWCATSAPRSEGLGAQKELGAAGLKIAGRLFGAWGEFRRDADRARLLEGIDPLKEELRTHK